MSRRARPHYRPGRGWILGVAFVDTLTRPVRLAQGFTFVRCCGAPRASSPHGLTAPGLASHDGISLRAVASGSRLLPTRPAKDFHLQSSAHARHTYALSARGHGAGKTCLSTGREATYRDRNAVARNRATSRAILNGEGQDDAEGGANCAAGGTALNGAADKALRRLATEYVYKVINTNTLR